MKALRVLLAIIALAALQSARAQSGLDELLGEGFVVERSSHVVGSFEGCRKDRTVELSDGSLFVCDEDSAHYAFEPKSLVLRDRARGRLVLMIDGRPYLGRFTAVPGRPGAIRPATIVPPEPPARHATGLPPVRGTVAPGPSDSAVTAVTPINPARSDVR